MHVRPYQPADVLIMLEIIKTAFAPQATLQPPSSAVRKTVALLEQVFGGGWGVGRRA